MIDPRTAPVAMLPILNAIAAQLIAKAAPLRVANVEDTEQMIAEAAEAGGFDVDAIEEELASLYRVTHIPALFAFSDLVASNLDHLEFISANCACLVRSIECVISEAV